MCGIAGVLDPRGELPPEVAREVDAMAGVLRHRGPDSAGARVDGRVAMANTRLAIIDPTAAANLPMVSADGKIWLCYNGEVTNFRQLRRELRLDDSHQFKTGSDTEVVLALYEREGIGFLRHLSGMFAFCLYDARAEKAWIVRDQYGMRPLFTMHHRGRLYFASELKAFFEVEGFQPRVNQEAMWHFLSLAYIPDVLTPYEGVDELQGGRLWEVDFRTGRAAEREYYQIRYDVNPSLTEPDVVKVLHDAMVDSVERNMISDAPLGLTLSGGYDTSSILVMAREHAPDRDLHTFSIVMDEESYSERRYQRAMAEHAKTIHHEIVVGPKEVEEHLIPHMAFMDEPSGDGAAIPSYALAKVAKEHVKVLLSGEGGDETFNAYETHVAAKIRERYLRWVPSPVRRAVHWGAHQLPCSYEKLSFDFLAKRFTEGVELSAADAHFHWRACLSEAEKAQLMPRFDPSRTTTSFFGQCYDSAGFSESLNRISLIDLKYFFIGDLMVKNDRTFMAHSIEARFPYMDRILMELVSSIPPEVRLKGFKRRYLQKKAMADKVPALIQGRSNFGLEMPHSLWFLGQLRPMAERYFTRERVERTGFLSFPLVDRLWREHASKKRDNGRSLWCILNLIVWFELFIHDGDYKRHLT